MDNGDVIRTKTVKTYFENDECSGWVSYSAAKNRRIVLLVLGDESEGPEDRLDPVAALQSFGWTPPPDPIPASADTHPKGGDVQQAPLVSGAVPKGDARG